MPRVLRASILACCLVLTSALSGCSADSTVIAVLAADEQGHRSLDADGLEERVDEICEGCTVTIYDAGGDADGQDGQFTTALAISDLVILDPVDPEQAESMTQRAGEVPVVAYGTFVPGADWFVGLSEAADVDSDLGSDLDAARSVIVRERKSFSYVPAAAMSSKAAEVAVGELADEPVGRAVEHEGVPSWLFDSVEVTVNDLTSVLVASGVLTLAELCEGETAKRCARLGFV